MAGIYRKYEPGLRISWGSVFSGVVVALASQFAFNMLAMGLGFGLNVTDNIVSFGTGAGIFMGLSAVISLLAGGFVASRVSGSFSTYRGILHGLVTWGFLLSSFYLVLTVGMLVSGLSTGETLSLSSLFTRGAGIWSFIALVLSAFSACVGGYLGISEEAKAAAAAEEERKKAA